MASTRKNLGNAPAKDLSKEESTTYSGNQRGLRKVSSTDNMICGQPSDLVVAKTNDVSLIDSQLLAPLLAAGAMVYWLYTVSISMQEEARAGDPNSYPVKSVSIAYPLAALVLYPSGVYFGMRLMDGREPFEIQKYVFVYNMYQCVVNAWVVYEMVMEVLRNPWYTVRYGFLPWGNKVQPGFAGFRMSWLVWIHYNNKYVELLDTLWMVLKKKKDQISFLHCYHHILLIWVWWHCCSTESGGEAWFGACVNSLIHVYMYGYYTMSLLKWSVEWMKIYMTTCQILQFVICLAHAIFVFYQTTYGDELRGYIPWEMCADQAFVMVNMLFLFGKFFYKSYVQKRAHPKEKKRE
jgi:elongation of very long chain fatty acids protein 4